MRTSKAWNIGLLGLGIVLATASAGCGKLNPFKSGKSQRDEGAALASPLSGNWAGTECEQGADGPDLPPPAFYRYSIRFTETQMIWSTRIYDEGQCEKLRPEQPVDIEARYVLASPQNTADGSVSIDISGTDEYGQPTQLFGLVKIEGDSMQVATFKTAAERPAFLEEDKALQFKKVP